MVDELAAIAFLGEVPEPVLRATGPLWEHVALGPGELLWEAGAPVEGLAVVLDGALAVELDGVEVGRVGPGELLGEASAFLSGNARSATLRAHTACRVARLPVATLHTLRWQRSPLYDALLDHALRTLSRRVSATNARIAERASGGVAVPVRAEPSVLARLWRALLPGAPARACPRLEPLLRRLPGLAEADGETVAALAGAFTAEPVQEGQVVFLEGEPGEAAYLVADGRVDVLRNVRGDRAERLATLGPGSLFGVNTLVERGPRTASCVAASPGWLYRIDVARQSRLRGPNRLAWRECLPGVLATQIRNANGGLRRAVDGGPTVGISRPRASDASAAAPPDRARRVNAPPHASDAAASAAPTPAAPTPAAPTPADRARAPADRERARAPGDREAPDAPGLYRPPARKSRRRRYRAAVPPATSYQELLHAFGSLEGVPEEEEAAPSPPAPPPGRGGPRGPSD